MEVHGAQGLDHPAVGHRGRSGRAAADQPEYGRPGQGAVGQGVLARTQPEAPQKDHAGQRSRPGKVSAAGFFQRGITAEVS